MKRFVLFGSSVIVLLVTFSCSFAQSKFTEHTLKLDEGSSPAPAELRDFQWLVGRWVGEGLGGECEEVFLPAWNGTMVGTFRYAKEGKLVFSEYFSFTQSDGGVVLKLKHFNPDLVGWEEKDGMVNFPLIRVENNAVYFGGLTYQLNDDGVLNVWVAMKNRSGDIGEAEFTFRSAPLDAHHGIDHPLVEAASGAEVPAQDQTSVKAVRKSVTVNCSRETAWGMWTTSEGIAKFFSPDSKIELKSGGAYEMFFGAPADENGLRGSEGSRVLGLIPNEMLIFEWTFPPNTPELRKSKKKIPVLITFHAITPNQTRVDLVHYGWEEGEEMEKGFKYFDQVWPHVLGAFKTVAEKE
jgi:uncharacterized protein YndB with AHSA1/START domain